MYERDNVNILFSTGHNSPNVRIFSEMGELIKYYYILSTRQITRERMISLTTVVDCTCVVRNVVGGGGCGVEFDGFSQSQTWCIAAALLECAGETTVVAWYRHGLTDRNYYIPHIGYTKFPY